MVSFVFHLEIIMTLLSQPPTWLRTLVGLALIGLMFFSFNPLLAQVTNPCGCTPQTTEKFYVHATECPNGAPSNNKCFDANGNEEAPTSFVVIEYTEVNCGGTISIQFKAAHFYGTKYSLPVGYSNQSADYKAAQSALLASLGTSVMSFVYPSGCQTLAEVSFPTPSPCYWFEIEGPNAGQIIGSIDLGNPSPVLKLVPCDGENCCKLDYRYNTTTGRVELISFPSNQPCPVSPPPNGTIEQTCLDVNGNPVTYIGTITYPNSCESYCGADLNTLFKTTKKGKLMSFDPNQLSLQPVPAAEKVYFNSTDYISKIEVFDINGKYYEGNFRRDEKNYDISELKSGVYFMRVKFEDGNLRTIKFIKE